MADLTRDDKAVRSLLEEAFRIAVVGASDKPERDSHQIFRFLQDRGYRVVPVNPTVEEVAGVKAAPDLAVADEMLGGLDIVDVFRNPDHVEPIVQDAIDQKARCVWFQFGVVNDEANRKALDAGLDIVVDRCIRVEHDRLM